MNSTAQSLSVMVNDAAKAALIKVSGRATFSSSVDFRNLVQRLIELKYRRFVLELSECTLMDSTFLGVLAGLALKCASGQPGGPLAIQLLKPRERISELLENLGVSHLFTVLPDNAEELAFHMSCFEQPSTPAATPLELAKTSLEAHNNLIRADEANRKRFTDVTRFLEEDIKRLEEAQAKQPAPASTH